MQVEYDVWDRASAMAAFSFRFVWLFLFATLTPYSTIYVNFFAPSFVATVFFVFRY